MVEPSIEIQQTVILNAQIFPLSAMLKKKIQTKLILKIKKIYIFGYLGFFILKFWI